MTQKEKEELSLFLTTSARSSEGLQGRCLHITCSSTRTHGTECAFSSGAPTAGGEELGRKPQKSRVQAHIHQGFGACVNIFRVCFVL